MRLLPVSSLCCLVLACQPRVDCDAAEATIPSETPVSSPSANLTAKIFASPPKFTPPPAKEVGVVPAEPGPSAPRNGIIRLPSYIVRDKKLPEFKKREMLTPAGRVDLALKRHPGLKFGPFASLNKGPALQMLAEEEELERRGEMSDLSGNLQYFDALRAAEDAPTPAPAAPPK